MKTYSVTYCFAGSANVQTEVVNAYSPMDARFAVMDALFSPGRPAVVVLNVREILVA